MSLTEGTKLTALPVTTKVGLPLTNVSTALFICSLVTLSIKDKYWFKETVLNVLN